MGLFARIANLIKPKQARIGTTSIVGYDTSLVYIPEYESLSEEEKKIVDEYIEKNNIQNTEDIVLYGEGVSKYSLGITELLLSTLYKTTEDVQLAKLDTMSPEERSKTRINAMLGKEQIEFYNQALQNLEKEVTLQAVALEKQYQEYKKENRVFRNIFKHPIQERVQKKFEQTRFSEAIERMKILKKTIEQQQGAVINASNNKRNNRASIEANGSIKRR